ncbi:MAG: hypothetical protein A2751_03020 [Candidatus Doudnabacteria bacterium RIFCSPHIGHO2_01_FULL_46_14]|uniref:Methyltransferase type 11 domain-containing protein n=1 Tax=Candidatus Doudnabacteria bacterium RIFCSPHIGHO2_01_FULL_46_14 TaxID=1817824 RepID=A0A1F5NKA2_9BACT|nr:MAG: hypothetical protein A2751_03020 [Candidatus Doudnabacteria bacterium RIFCSPHIGHO2_01_FULL_46_14]
MTSWEKFFDEKIREIAKENYIVDVGSGLKFGKHMKQYETLFAGKKFLTFDKEGTYRPDIVGDIHAIPLPDASVDAVLCNAVLEHVEEPGKAVAEIHRILKPGGKAFFYVPFLYPYHAEKRIYKDFYRFSKDGVEYLLRNFSKLEYVPVRGFAEMWLYFLPFRLNRLLSPVGRILDSLLKRGGNQTSGFNIFVIK